MFGQIDLNLIFPRLFLTRQPNETLYLVLDI